MNAFRALRIPLALLGWYRVCEAAPNEAPAVDTRANIRGNRYSRGYRPLLKADKARTEPNTTGSLCSSESTIRSCLALSGPVGLKSGLVRLRPSRIRPYVPNGSQFVGRLRALHSSCGMGMRVGTWPPGTPGSMVPSRL